VPVIRQGSPSQPESQLAHRELCDPDQSEARPGQRSISLSVADTTNRQLTSGQCPLTPVQGDRVDEGPNNRDHRACRNLPCRGQIRGAANNRRVAVAGAACSSRTIAAGNQTDRTWLPGGADASVGTPSTGEATRQTLAVDTTPLQRDAPPLSRQGPRGRRGTGARTRSTSGFQPNRGVLGRAKRPPAPPWRGHLHTTAHSAAPNRQRALR
jgi:hypothetical protein